MAQKQNVQNMIRCKLSTLDKNDADDDDTDDNDMNK